MGTGKRVNFAFNNSDSKTHYEVGYRNPYYTVDGISRGFTLSYKETDFDEVDTARYLTDIGLLGVDYGIPISETDRIKLNFDLVNTTFKIPDDASDEIAQFQAENGDDFLDFRLGAGWTRDSRNSALFPTRGGLQRFSANFTLPGSDLEYYKIAYKHKQYLPLNKTFTLALNGDVAYGDSYGDTTGLPLWENYFGGGVRTVRGFKDYSLGPRDSNDDPLGGNMRVGANAELFFPAPFKGTEKSVRLGVFFDAGAIYDTTEDSFDIGELRYSTGLSLFWMSPIGPLGMSLGYPLNDKSEDETESFQFLLGTSF